MKYASVFKRDMFRQAHGWKLYFSVIAGLVLILRPLFASNMLGHWAMYSEVELLSVPLATSDFTPFSVVFCLLPFAESFCDDYGSGYVHHIVTRISPRRYVLQRCLSTAISGGIVMGSIMALTILVCILLGAPVTSMDDMHFLENTLWNKAGLLYIWNGNLMYMMRILIAFLFGCVWSLVGLAVSAFVPNRYVTLVFPFVLYQFLWFLFNELPFNPVYMFRGDSDCIPSLGFLFSYQFGWIGLCTVLSYVGIMRKVRI